MEWHDQNCRKADIVYFGDGRSCLSCGAVAPECSSTLLPPIRQLADIRILSLKFGRSSDPVVCDISTHDLSSHPEYDAISYTWADESGDAAKSRNIQVSGKPFPVTANCENALRRVRRRFSDRNIWIDAVCVDQDNIEERGHQVRLMPRIYASARHVLIYVGEATERSTAALASITDGPIQWGPFLEVMARRYFTRAWTLQEVALARNATLLCGQDSIPWSRLAQIIRTISPATFDPPQQPNILLQLPSQLSFDYTLYSSPGKVLDLLDLGRRTQANDPRDKIFSLLGLMPGGRMGDIEADYSMNTCRLYTKVAEFIASQHGWLAVLARAGTVHSSMTALPSWVPDWSHMLHDPPPDQFSFHPYVNGFCDSDKKTLIIKFLVLGAGSWYANAFGPPPVKPDLNMHWDSYVAQRTKTHLWSTGFTSLNQLSTACLDFLTCLLEATYSAVDENTCDSIVSHQMGILNLDLFSNSICRQRRALKSRQYTSRTSPLYGVSIETAVQIFTLTIAEMVHLDIFTKLGVVSKIPNGLKNQNDSQEDHASTDPYLEAILSDSRAELASEAPTDPALGNIWSTKYNAGELTGVEARNQSSLRITSYIGRTQKPGPTTYTATNVTAAQMERGLWSTRHPLFAEANEVLWKLFLHRYLYREVSITLF